MKNFPKLKTTASAILFVLMISALTVVFSASAFAQATRGTLRGTITDPNGNVVAGATVTAKNQDTGNSDSFTTKSDGIYVFAGLLPGQYTVTVEPTAGFSRKATTNVTVVAGQDTDISVALVIGSASETVTVTGTGGDELVQKDQSQISSTFEARKIEDLPSNGAGGGIDTLALLVPGVHTNRSGGTNTNGTGLSVNGNRGRSNNFQIDGADNNDLSVAGPALFVDNQDQIQEFQVVTNNFSAQYGRNQGAIVNIVTKGGTNQFHGSLFEFHQDNAYLNSLDNKEKASGQLAPNASLYNVYGGSIGGPVYLPRFGEGGKSVISGKDRIFFFATFQGIRNPSISTLRGTGLGILPSEFPRLLATFPTSVPIQVITTSSPFALTGSGPVGPRTDRGATAIRYINPTTNAISTTPAAGFLGPFQVGGAFDVINLNGNLFQAAFPERQVSTPFKEDQYSFRFDVKATEKDNITVRYLHQTSASVNGLATSNGFTGDIPAGSKNFGGTYTRQISNTLINEARANYQIIAVKFGGGSVGGIGQIPDPASIGTAFTNIAFGITGVNSKSALATIGPATNLPQGRIGKVYQAADNLTYVRGRQTFIFGAEYKHINEVVPFLPSFNGAYTFGVVSGPVTGAAARLINNAPSAFSLTGGDPTLAFKENDQYYFVQDDFKLRPNLTLNLGVRYEYTGQPINVLHDQSVIRESNPATAFYDQSLPLDVRTVPSIKPDRNNFAPRVGFAYTPHFAKRLFGEDATVIRGGFSIAYDPAFYNILLNVQGGAPFSAALALSSGNALVSTTTSPVPLLVNPLGNLIRAAATASGALPLGKLNPIYLAQTTVAPDFRAPYSEQYSLGFQRQINRSNVFEARYVGTHGVALFQNINANFFIGPLVNGFNRGQFTTGSTTNPYFPSFANLLPAGTKAQVCVDNPATPFVNESACNGRLLPQAGVTTRANSGQSIYHSLQTRYNGRFLKNSLLLGATYTWSKTIDNASEIFAETDVNSASAQNPFDTSRGERSLSALDIPHNFTFNYIYDVPFFKEQHGLIGHLLGGYQFNGVYVLSSGSPFTPGQTLNGALGLGGTYLTAGDRPFVTNSNVDPRQVGISWIDANLLFGIPLPTGVTPATATGFYSFNQLNTTGNSVIVTPNDVHFIFNGPGAAKIFGTPFGTSTRNSLRGPKLNQLNMSLFKNNKIGERVNIQLRADAFNILNHPNPGYGVARGNYLPNISVENAGSAGGGFADFGDMELARRVIQVGLRIVF